MQGVDGVFHLAGWYTIGVRDKRPGAAVNIEGTRNVLELMRDLRVPKAVYWAHADDIAHAHLLAMGQGTPCALSSDSVSSST